MASEVTDHNPRFGFSCLHYSVSEGAGAIRIKVLNKSGKAGEVSVKTRDDTATGGSDYEKIDKLLEFKKGQDELEVMIKIFDDDEWEPDEDFYVDLHDAQSNARLIGQDTSTRVTIIDDDKPGMIVFREKRALRHDANEVSCKIKVDRVQGSDGKISVKYRTIELDKSDNTAIPGRDYTTTEGVLEFAHGEVEREIVVPIIQRDNNEERDEIFGVKLYDPTPAIVKISKKDTCIVEIVTDAQKKKQSDSLQQLLDKINREENITWKQQFINACMLHPTKNEDGVIEDIGGFDAVLHFLSIGWKFLFAACPPPHKAGGWACFIVAICFIGGITYIVGEVAGMMGCVMGIKPGVTAITFVAIGTSLPDTFASMTAAKESRYADAAVGNVTGSNSVNVFLGLGIPWLVAVIYSN